MKMNVKVPVPAKHENFLNILRSICIPKWNYSFKVAFFVYSWTSSQECKRHILPNRKIRLAR
ncbi:hypothetical protein OUZ56_028521 [Daphnia magna]|uniref:Uncharacterized protein n=1 Tax=Daphnia magna TaxID=35525 RepID=A0ABR0B4P7_9CRUS|nr:hypothetical protein OUZ56_028521 [Daphnia magna]